MEGFSKFIFSEWNGRGFGTIMVQLYNRDSIQKLTKA
jgi:hypothetical protein